MSWSDMPQPAEDEFSSFLEFGFPDLEGQHGPTDHIPSRSVAHQVAGMATSTAPPQQQQVVCLDSDGVTDQSQSYTRMLGDFSVEIASHGQQGIPHSSSYSNGPMTPAFYTQKPQMFHSAQIQQQAQPQSSQPYIPQGQMIIPPTPNSIELHGNAAPYPQRVGDNPEIYDRYSRMMEEQALYTPLVSPAMTPLESQFRQPEYTIPGEYFSPLSSPAIEAQHTNNPNGFPIHSGPLTEVNFVPSPIDNSFPLSSAPSSPGLTRKNRRRPSVAGKSFQSRARKQQSPSVRPMVRTKSRLTDEVMSTLTEGQVNPTSHPLNGTVSHFGSAESSGQDSVSPEPLSEPLMPPPALPPARRSPAIAPQTQQQPNPSEPATPAMLMRMQRSPHARSAPDHNLTPTQQPMAQPQDEVMEDVVLPEAANPQAHLFRPQVARIDTAMPTSTSSPNMPVNATTHPDTHSASLSESNHASVAPSPRSVAMPSPSGPAPRKSDTPKLGPMGRKRQSLSSSHPSPSLRPKISPNIQPLVSGDTSAAYLAGLKSNYQQILEGTLLPGVSYPETLAENLSSKRTNHKLAEQGRRNRINTALKEIEALIPAAYVQMKLNKEAATCNGKTEKEKEKAGNQQISKASTVEMAIDYIKSLQAELGATKTKLAAAEAKLGTSETIRETDGSNGVQTGEKQPGESNAVNQSSELNHSQSSTIEGP
ncbi:phosphate-sensing transcription factor PHO4 [Aspergillus mulundensis]|uniref:PHO4-like protein n=1 Tax=Aspergillus mulundensis TaxID=1810919 RepID=A0A3D8T3R4_9EURO|nr:PHO4-like protein [Aspergillus mulundensis]RDW93195.1 PHO4-like protein [Aspergillus mulundensis]